MDEAEWLTPRFTAKLLRYVSSGWMGRLLGGRSHRAGQRKLRLLHCVCCRSMWEELPEASRAAVQVAERYADGEASRREFQASRRKAEAVAYDGLTGNESWWGAFWGKLAAGDWGYDGRLGFVVLNTDSPSDLREWADDMQTKRPWAK